MVLFQYKNIFCVLGLGFKTRSVFAHFGFRVLDSRPDGPQGGRAWHVSCLCSVCVHACMHACMHACGFSAYLHIMCALVRALVCLCMCMCACACACVYRCQQTDTSGDTEAERSAEDAARSQQDPPPVQAGRLKSRSLVTPCRRALGNGPIPEFVSESPWCIGISVTCCCSNTSSDS